MDKRALGGQLKDMEQAAEKVLQQDSAFFEALQALKWEIDSNPRVQSAIRALQGAGQRVFSSFVPRIKVRIRTDEGIFALAKQPDMQSASGPGHVAKLTQELKNAASAVIMTSRHCQELERIVNESVTASDNFESLASDIEKAGHEVLISLDLSAYAQIQASTTAPDRLLQSDPRESSDEPAPFELSADDLTFLKAMKIKADENLSC